MALNNLQWLICRKTKPNETKLHTFILGSLFDDKSKFKLYVRLTYPQVTYGILIFINLV